MKYFLNQPDILPGNHSWAQGAEIISWANRKMRIGFENDNAVLRFVEEVKDFVNEINNSFSRGCRLEVRVKELSFDRMIEIHALRSGGPSLVAKFVIKRVFTYINEEGGEAWT